MVRVLEHACIGELSEGHNLEARPEYQVVPLLENPAAAPLRPTLHWLDELLALLEEDKRAARFASRFIPEKCYNGLLRDAFLYALAEVETSLGLNFGDREEWSKSPTDQKLRSPKPEFEDVSCAGVLAHRSSGVLLPSETSSLLER